MAQTLVTLLRERVWAEPTGEASRHLHGRHVVTTTWGEWYRRSQVLAAGLVELGVEPGDRVALMSRTRVEWTWLDMAIVMAGGITVPIFPTEPAAACADLLGDCGARVVLAESPGHVQKLLGVRDALGQVETLVYLDREGPAPGGAGTLVIDEVVRDVPLGFVWSQSELRDRGERALRTVAAELDARAAALRPDTPATITYTPGTEGRPKGVILTHGNFTSTSAAISRALGLVPGDLQLVYLPLAHAFGRICAAVGLEAGISTAYARRYRTVAEDCQTFRPTFLCSIPRLFEAMEAKTRRELDQTGGLPKLVASWARSAGEGGFLGGLKQLVVDRLVASPVREELGGRLRFLVSGAGPLKVETARFFEEMGLPILQGYGMTETAACTHLSRLGANRFGAVGQPLAGVETRLLPDGELCVRGPNVAPGYWNRPEETRRALDAEGWLHTGDLCTIDADGFLSVTDRKRNIILTSTGKVVAPQPLVRALTSDPLIADVLIYGEQCPFLSALVVLDPEALSRFAAREGLEGDYEALSRDPRVYRAVETVLDRVNAERPPHEHIRKFAILAKPLTEGSDELTATHVLRRRVATEKYKTLLDSFYSERY